MAIGSAADLDPAFDPRYGAEIVTYLPKGGAAVDPAPAAILSAPERFERLADIPRETSRWVAEILVSALPSPAKDDQLIRANGMRFTVNKVDQDGEAYAWRLELTKQ